MTKESQTPVIHKRTEYKPLDFTVSKINLDFNILDNEVQVTSELQISKLHNNAAELVLDGENMALISIEMDGKPLASSDYTLAETQLIIPVGKKFEFVLKTTNSINPWENTSLSGLYKSGNILCTQNEAEGFRKITWFLDRPDNMCRFTTRIEADKKQYPVLLSNGNLVDSGEAENSRHFVVWDDPFLKPSYLYALVAGDLGVIKDTYLTMSDRTIDLAIYTDPGQEKYSYHAMEALKKSMKWDEETFGREYDLDLYMIVSVDSFNAGAMENKGLNIFNSKYVMADKDTATDKDKEVIEAVIAHEYFHNWTGNRVTCRDWFQLTLKEGLTVFRDQEFTSDTASRPIKRIEDARVIKEYQFSEDAGPNKHPIRPESYMEVDNLYTATVYEKGAEVIRMIHTLIGKENFRKGMDLYFDRHDGQAVTCDDFVAAMADASGTNLEQFKKWYSREGTPEIEIDGTYDEDTSQFVLTVEQKNTSDPLAFPLRMSLVAENGRHLLEDTVLQVTSITENFTFEGIQENVVPSLFHQFSSPVKWHYPYEHEDLITLFAYDKDSYSRYEAGQRILLKDLEAIFRGEQDLLRPSTLSALKTIVEDKTIEQDFTALLITLPGLESMGDYIDNWHFPKLSESGDKAILSLGDTLEEQLMEIVETKTKNENSESRKGVACRALKVKAIQYLANFEKHRSLVREIYMSSENMTISMGSLSALCQKADDYRDEALSDFYGKWKDNFNLMNKWLAMQTGAKAGDAFDKVSELENHELFDIKNPNRVRSVYGAFAMNKVGYHHPSGRGYELIADKIIKLDSVNPFGAAHLARSFEKYAVLPAELKELMTISLDRTLEKKDLSKGTYEILSKTRNS